MENYHIDDVISVQITSIRNYGALVLADNGQRGLLHISEISPFFVANIDEFISVNEVINVKVLETDATTGFLKVSLKQLQPEGRKHKKRRKHEKINDSEIDFSPLEQQLPIWIKQAKEQIHD